MARTAITVQTPAVLPDFFGNCTAASAAAGNHVDGMEFVHDGNTVVVVLNGDSVARTVTGEGVADENGRIANVAHSIAAGEVGIFIFRKPQIWNQSTGKMNLAQSAGGTALKYWAFRLP